MLAMAGVNWTLLSVLLVTFLVALQESLVAEGARSRGEFDGDNLALKTDEDLLLETRPILHQPIVDFVNGNKHSTWKAGHNPRFEGVTVKDFKRLCGVLEDPTLMIVPVEMHLDGMNKKDKAVLPKSFDAREAWPRCESIGTILDQGHCGSCWAFGAVEALSDRFCIHGFENVTLSENDLLSCCGSLCGYGCDGGYPYRAWQYFQADGVVSESCDPYFDTQGCGHPGCSPEFETPSCSKSCVGAELLWTEQKHYASTAYYLDTHPDELMFELYLNGPFEVSFDVYEDFAHYVSGVYKHTTGSYMGGHAVKLIGWGTTEDGVDYWVIVNSWNRSWGEDGIFRIVRGKNDCDIETGAVGGIPYLKGRLLGSNV